MSLIPFKPIEMKSERALYEIQFALISNGFTMEDIKGMYADEIATFLDIIKKMNDELKKNMR